MTAVPVTSRQPSPVRSAGSASARAQPGALLVTGGSRGIGAATARLAAGQGNAVAINYRTTNESAAAVVAEIESTGGRPIAVQADVSQEREVERLFEEVDRRLGRLSALVILGGHRRRARDPLCGSRAGVAWAPVRAQRDRDYVVFVGLCETIWHHVLCRKVKMDQKDSETAKQKSISRYLKKST
jgi:NADPH:quinone reductase-like Zn-dependent oxidoreductase